MMTVDASQTKNLTVDLSDWTVRNIVLKQLYELFNLESGMYVKDGKLISDVEVGGGSHSWYNEEVKRDATDEDIAALLIIAKVKKEL